MRRRATLPFVLLLGLVFAIGTTPSLLADEGTPGPFGEGLQITTTQQPNTKTERDQAYNILFNHGAYINEEKSENLTKQPLIVKVLSGKFAFRVQADVIVDPQDHDIQILAADPSIAVGDPVTQAHNFVPKAAIAATDCPGIPPTAPTTPPTTPTRTLCLVNPALVESLLGASDGFIELDPGFMVYLPPNSQCFFCNVTGKTGDDTSANNKADQASLLVWGPRSGFSWQTKSQQSMRPGAGAPEASTLHGAVGWKVMLNPGSPCH
jgi:hypothetical protein